METDTTTETTNKHGTFSDVKGGVRGRGRKKRIERDKKSSGKNDR